MVSCLVHSLSHPPSLVCSVHDAPGFLPHLQLVSLPVQFLPNKTELLGTHKEGIIGDKVAHKPHQNKHLQGYRTVSFKLMPGGKRGGGGGEYFTLACWYTVSLPTHLLLESFPRSVNVLRWWQFNLLVLFKALRVLFLKIWIVFLDKAAACGIKN